MKLFNRYGWLLLGGLLFLSPLASTQGQSPANHVVLISIDGLRPEFYRDQTWPMPLIQHMAREGTQAKAVRGVFPSVTYPSHTTILTGALPVRHGIYYNAPFERGGQTGAWYWNADQIRTPTLWDAVRKAGMKSASVSWPVSVGAPVDYNVPEVWSLDPQEDRLAPMKALATPPGLTEELEREASGKMNEASFGKNSYLAREARFGAMAAYLLETYQPALLTVHLASADHFQHEEGREGLQVRTALSAVDAAIAQIVEAADRAGILARTAFIVTGDHGFVDLTQVVAPNVWLAREGLLEDRKDRGAWQAAFHTSGAAAFLQLNKKGDTRTLKKVRALLQALPEAEKKLFRVVERAELDQIGADPNVPLALAPVRGVNMSAATNGAAVKPTKGGTHGFFPDLPDIHTGFVGWGAGLRKGSDIAMMGLEDVAPVVAYLLGLPFKSPDGKLPAGIVTEMKP